MKDIDKLVRPCIAALTPYSTARDEYKGELGIFLDANESPYENGYNRYPDPLQKELKELIASLKGVRRKQIFLGNGSDEAIDLVFRTFCKPGVDNVVAIDPTYGMYQVCADVNDVEYRKVLLDANYHFTADKVMLSVDENTKAIFLCSPNNPTGNNLGRQEIEKLLETFEGLVVVDEAYIDFSDARSFLLDLDKYPNLIVLQTFSKAWGCAAIRLGMAFASEAIIDLFNKIKYPYNVNELTQRQAIELLKSPEKVKEWVEILLKERERVMSEFVKLNCCRRVFPSDANFFLTKVKDAKLAYAYLVSQGIIVRNRTNIALCGDCLRITIGTPEENDKLLEALKNYIE